MTRSTGSTSSTLSLGPLSLDLEIIKSQKITFNKRKLRFSRAKNHLNNMFILSNLGVTLRLPLISTCKSIYCEFQKFF